MELIAFPAAFGRLRVETTANIARTKPVKPAAFGRLRVETSKVFSADIECFNQPPSGGCVLKRESKSYGSDVTEPAAFGRLRVETDRSKPQRRNRNPAAFGRLRVETTRIVSVFQFCRPAAFGRLRVETYLMAR